MCKDSYYIYMYVQIALLECSHMTEDGYEMYML